VTTEPRWIDREVLHLLYARQVELFGGAFGIRDENLLESALNRPRMRHRYDPGADLFDLAAGYLFGFARNHPFLDGNKRVATASAFTFLYVNGYRLVAPFSVTYPFVIGVATGEIGEAEAAEWLRRHAEPR
jgi:death on curing protein